MFSTAAESRVTDNSEPETSVDSIGAVLLFATLGTGEAVANGRRFSAYLGLTPKQHSSAGKVKLIGINKKTANKRMRAILIQGVPAYVHRLKEPRSCKDRWLKDLIERAGTGKVALANKNVRTAWALLTNSESHHWHYQHEQLAA